MWDDQIRLAKEAHEDLQMGLRTTELTPQENKVLNAVGVSEAAKPKKTMRLSESTFSTGKSSTFTTKKRPSVDMMDDTVSQSKVVNKAGDFMAWQSKFAIKGGDFMASQSKFVNKGELIRKNY